MATKSSSKTLSERERARRARQAEEATAAERAVPEDEGPGYQELGPEAQTTSPAQWKGAQGVALKLPSGNVCRVRRSGLEGLIASGHIPNSLLPLVTQALSSGTVPDQAGLARSIEADPSKIGDLFGMYDQVCIHTVIKPRVLPVPVDDNGKEIPLSERPDVDGLWIDMVDLDDKMAVWNYATRGTGELDKFRP